jgi:hypothetical protein
MVGYDSFYEIDLLLKHYLIFLFYSAGMNAGIWELS